jgi:hypothetical protein
MQFERAADVTVSQFVRPLIGRSNFRIALPLS